MNKYLTALIVLLILNFPSFSAGWEMINSGVDIRNVAAVGDTWFGIQRVQQGTMLQMLLVSSVNKGYTWQTNTYFKELYTLTAYKNKLIVYADRPTERGFYLSTDKGSTWKKLVGPFNVGASAAYITDEAIFITIQKNPGIVSPIYRSTNGGDSFQPLTLDVGSSSFNFARSYGNMTTFDGLLFVYVGRVGIFKSSNGGDTWIKVNDGLATNAGDPNSSNVSGVLSQTGNNLYFYLSDNDLSNSYIYKNGVWEIHNPDTYHYQSAYKDYFKGQSIIPSPTAYREPYLFSIDLKGIFWGICYSIDDGKSWYDFADLNIGWVYWNAILIDGDYVYAGSSLGFCRRKLSDAKNYSIKESRTDLNLKLPASPEEFANLLNLIGPEGLEEMLSQAGVDPEGLYTGELKDFMSDYSRGSGSSSSGLFGNSQPGSCSIMGMPAWSINVANLKLFVRDVLFRKKGKGLEVKIAMNYLNKPVINNGLFGKRWCFDYESSLTKRTSSVILETGTGAKFVFSNNATIPGGTSPFTLPCLNNPQFELQWNGSAWIVSINRGAEKRNFIQRNDSVFVLKELVDSYNQKTTLTYNEQGLISSVTDAANRKYNLYNSNGHCDSIEAPDGHRARFAFDNNLLLSVSDFDGVKTVYSYNTAEDIVEVNISGKQTKFEYNYLDDTNGMISAVSDPENRRIEYTSSFINETTLLTTINYPGGKLIAYTITNGMVTSVINSAGEEKKVFYNSGGNIDSLVYFDGSKVTFNYDSRKNVIAKKDRNNVEYSYKYDNANNLIQQIKLPSDTVFTKTYNLKNQLTSIVLPGNLTTNIYYDVNGALAGIKSPEGNTHSFSRDGFGNVISYTNPLNQTTNIQYDAAGFKPVSRTDFEGNSYGMEYDGNGRLKKISLPGGSFKSINYDCCTQTGITDENGNVISVLRDATNRILSYHYAEGWSYSTDYDSEGFVSGFTNKYGMKTQLKYNQRGKLVSVSDEEGSVLLGYNNSGNPINITDKKGNVIQYAYNDNGRISDIIDAVGAKVSFEYDSGNNLAVVTNARGQKIQMLYNKQGLVQEKKINSDTESSYTYNKDGLLTTFTDASGITQFVRNAAGFVTKISYPGNLEVSFTYDVNGNLLNTTYPNGLFVSNQCDVLNRIKKVSWGISSVEFTYNPAGYMLTETRNNGTKTLYSYNKDNLPVSIEHQYNNTAFSSETLNVSSGIINGIITKSPIAITRQPQSFLGAEINQLNQVKSSFDGYGFTYDADGNMTNATQNGSQVFLATYTPDNKISSLQADNQSTQLFYDGMHYPRKIISGGNTRNLYYDHKGRLLFETDATGMVVKNYIYKGKRLIAMQTSENQPNFYHSNRLGHILAITGGNGAIISACQYSANGEIIGESGDASNRFTFLGAFGGIRLNNNFILTGARVYHTLTGRYIQRDPLGMLTGTNPYLYAANNPVSGIDPLGFDDLKVTVNDPTIDPPSDNNYSNPNGTANPYADNLPARGNDWDTYGSAIDETAKEFSQHPITDLIPKNPVSAVNAIDAFRKNDFGGGLWQLMPFNNTLEWIGTKIIEAEGGVLKPNDSPGSGGTYRGIQTSNNPCEL